MCVSTPTEPNRQEVVWFGQEGLTPPEAASSSPAASETCPRPTNVWGQSSVAHVSVHSEQTKRLRGRECVVPVMELSGPESEPGLIDGRGLEVINPAAARSRTPARG